MSEAENESVTESGEIPRPRRRGVLAIPTLLTIMNVLFGFITILLAMRASEANALGDPLRAGRLFQLACWALIVSAIFDTFDGLVARLMKATTEFGKEYDSLADVVTFGVAPAVLVYAWALHNFGRLGAGIAFLFLVAGSLRLARFNVISAKTDHRYFVGLPIPAGALTLSSIINYAPQPVTDRNFAMIMMVVTIFIAFAMVSTVRYRSQKFKNVQKPVPVQVVLFVVLMIAMFLKWPAEFMLVFGIFYISSGPVVKLWNVAFPRTAEAEATTETAPTEQH
ncbi:MAG: CDP-diacylglycerol--serine O-phosphatidyltransferase [Thermoanaerobaculia bacterium]